MVQANYRRARLPDTGVLLRQRGLDGPGASGLPMSPRGGRSWLAAQPSRLLADLPGGSVPAPNRDIRQQLAVLRARSRWLAQNDGYAAGFLKMLRRNVVGPKGFSLQMRVPADRGDGQDVRANQIIEGAFAEWARVGSCDVTGRHSFVAICQMLVAGVARDGEALVRLRLSSRFNRFGFALEVLDPSQLDETVNGRPALDMPAGHVVRMGVELDADRRPAAYWLRTVVPNDDPAAIERPRVRLVRVPAAEIIHLFVAEWPDQVRGIPWLAPGIRTLAMLSGYAEAELTAARVSANKMGFYELDPEGEVDGELAEDGKLVQSAEAGSFELLPKGVRFKGYDPQHPNAAFKDFVGATLRPTASGVGFSYNAFANDAAGMNYSTLRATELDDRDEFRTLQQWMIDSFAHPVVFDGWMREALLANQLGGLPAAKYAKFRQGTMEPRGWQWVDPLKEVAALEKAIALGITSRTQAIAERGGDRDSIVADLTEEVALFAGITPAPKPSALAAEPRDPAEDE